MFWDKPVSVNGMLIFGPKEAARFLVDWPHPTNLSFATAVACIHRALDGRASPDHARELFEAAVAAAAPLAAGAKNA